MVVFVCSQAQLRSRTAELLCLFGGVDARCCGTDDTAIQPISDTMLACASLVVCIESQHKTAISNFCHFDERCTVVLDIRDVFNRFDDQLIYLLIQKVAKYDEAIADAMTRGAELLKSLPGHLKSLG